MLEKGTRPGTGDQNRNVPFPVPPRLILHCNHWVGDHLMHQRSPLLPVSRQPWTLGHYSVWPPAFDTRLSIFATVWLVFFSSRLFLPATKFTTGVSTKSNLWRLENPFSAGAMLRTPVGCSWRSPRLRIWLEHLGSGPRTGRHHFPT